MAEIEIVKYDSTAQHSMDKGYDQQIKTYDMGSEAGTAMPVPLDSKDGVTLAMVSHHQGWSLWLSFIYKLWKMEICRQHLDDTCHVLKEPLQKYYLNLNE